MNYKEKLNKINTFIFDIDGVFTDGTIVVDSQGNESRCFNTKDGIAVKLATELGYNVGIITGANNLGIKARLNRLGVVNVYINSSDKVKDLKDYCSKNNIDLNKTMYMGDDLPDFQIMQSVGLPTCPDNAANEIKNLSDYISPKKGGEGCVRDVIEQTLKIQGKWSNDSTTTSI